MRGASSPFWLPEEEESLFGLLHQMFGVEVSGELRWTWCCPPIPLPVSREERVQSSWPSCNQLCPGVSDKDSARTPLLQLLDLHSVEGLIIVGYKSHHSGVICKLHNHVCGLDCEESRAEDTALQCAGFQDQWGKCNTVYPPVARWWGSLWSKGRGV